MTPSQFSRAPRRALLDDDDAALFPIVRGPGEVLAILAAASRELASRDLSFDDFVSQTSFCRQRAVSQRVVLLGGQRSSRPAQQIDRRVN